MKYNDITRRYFEQAHNAGRLEGEGVVRGKAGQIDEGTEVSFEVRIVAKRVQAARFLALGCPHTIAVAAFVAEQAVGGGTEGLPEPVSQLAAKFEVPPAKLGRLLAIEDAWLAALRR